MPPSLPPRRLSLVPPELEALDAGWGDEPATLVPPRSPSGAPRRAPSINMAPSDEGPSSDRVTAIPDEPKEAFARRLMEGASATSTPPSRLPTTPAPAMKGMHSSIHDRGAEETPQLQTADPFERPTRAGVRAHHPSEFPTAPPPQGNETGGDARTAPRVPRPVAPSTLSWHHLPTTEPPARETADLASSRNFARAPEPPVTSREPASAFERARRAVTPRVRDIMELDRSDVAAPSESADELEFTGRFGSQLAPSDPLEEMKDRFATGDFSGALATAEGILQFDPGQADAKQIAAKCREVLYDMYASRIAGAHRQVRVVMGADQLRWLSLDHRAGFLLAMIDGVSTVEELLDVSGMPRLDTMRIICDLLDKKVIGLGA